MDEDDSGVSVSELAFPLIALGLATNTSFVKLVMKVLAPLKFGKGQFEDELTIKEFSTLFKIDAPNEKMVAKLKEELDEIQK